jgi:hypothetical protein
VVVTEGAGTVIDVPEPAMGPPGFEFQVTFPITVPDMLSVMGGFDAYLQIRYVLAEIEPVCGLQ